MWPKAFAQLVELAPHISRLLPMADRFFQSKTTGDDANRRAMEAMAEGLRGDLGQVTTAHAGLYRQLGDLDAKLDGIAGRLDGAAADARAATLAAESLQGRLAAIEARQGRISTLLTIVLALLAVLCILVALIYAHSR